jgi:hypothetical protein
MFSLLLGVMVPCEILMPNQLMPLAVCIVAVHPESPPQLTNVKTSGAGSAPFLSETNMSFEGELEIQSAVAVGVFACAEGDGGARMFTGAGRDEDTGVGKDEGVDGCVFPAGVLDAVPLFPVLAVALPVEFIIIVEEGL